MTPLALSDAARTLNTMLNYVIDLRVAHSAS